MPKDKYIEGLKGLAIYQIIGGSLGVLLVGFELYLTSLNTPLILLIFFVGFALNAFSVYCGIQLFRKQVRSIEYSLVNQYLQLVTFAGSGFLYGYVAGLAIYFQVQAGSSVLGGFKFSLSTWQIQIGQDFSYGFVGINLVAGALVMVLHHELRGIAREKLTDQISSIGSQQSL